MLEFEVVDESVWQSLAPTTKRKSTKWDAILQQLEEGKIIRIPLDEKEKRSYRIGIGRTATSRGYKVEFRDGEGVLVMRKTDLPTAAKKSASSDATGERRRGRPRTNPEAHAARDGSES